MQNKSSFSTWNSYFDVGEHTITVSGSYFTGFEYVYIDDQLVSKKLNCTFKSTHNITLDGVNYDVLIELLSVFKPQIRIQILRDDDVLDEDYLFEDGKNGKRQLRNLWISLGVSFGAGMLSYLLVNWLMGG